MGLHLWFLPSHSSPHRLCLKCAENRGSQVRHVLKTPAAGSQQRLDSSLHHPIWMSKNATGWEAPGLCDTQTVLPAGRGHPATSPRFSSGGPATPSFSEGFVQQGHRRHTRAGLADGPEGKRHARDEGVPGVRGQGGVGGGVGWDGPIAQRGRVDVGVEPWGERGVRRLLHGTRDHQLEEAANTRRSVRAGGLRGLRRCARLADPEPRTPPGRGTDTGTDHPEVQAVDAEQQWQSQDPTGEDAWERALHGAYGPRSSGHSSPGRTAHTGGLHVSLCSSLLRWDTQDSRPQSPQSRE